MSRSLAGSRVKPLQDYNKMANFAENKDRRGFFLPKTQENMTESLATERSLTGVRDII